MTHPNHGVRSPTVEEIRDAGRVHNLDLSTTDAEMLGAFIADTVASYARIDDLSGPPPAASTDRTYRSEPDDDPLNAFISGCAVGRDEVGPLSGYTVGLKDNIALAGVPMTCGWQGLEERIPSSDATVVTRLLDSGATITGKLNMEALAFGGSGELSDFGPVRNPHDRGYLAGGSSSGCAAAVVAGDVDVAIGTDAGGSIRRPAAWCGCVGLKPTFGLVPYTGIVSQAYTLDHAGPMARTVLDCARTLEVIAGQDGLDTRQSALEPAAYVAAATRPSPDDVSVAVIDEGFGQHPVRSAVDERVRDALAAFEAAGAVVSSRSVPRHDDGEAIWTAINLEELIVQSRHEGERGSTTEFIDPEWHAAYAAARRERAAELPPTLKLALVTGEYVSRVYEGRFYVEARRLCQQLAAAYDSALADADVLALPTIPTLPHEIRDDLSEADLIERALGFLRNRAPFNATGHPVISIPAGTVDGFPIGVSFVGRRGDDETVLHAAAAFEATVTP